MKNAQILIILLFIHDAFTLKCHHCGLVEHERCEKVNNLPRRECDEPTLEDKERYGMKAVCVKITRIPTRTNRTFYGRQCGIHRPENDTCSFLESLHEDTSHNFTCWECEKDLCNGTTSSSVSNVSIIALIMKTLSILYTKLF